MEQSIDVSKAKVLPQIGRGVLSVVERASRVSPPQLETIVLDKADLPPAREDGNVLKITDSNLVPQ